MVTIDTVKAMEEAAVKSEEKEVVEMEITENGAIAFAEPEAQEAGVIKTDNTNLIQNAVQKLKQIENELNIEYMERETEVKSLLLGLVSGKHVLLLGDPGTGKSAITKSFSNRIGSAEYFQWLLSKTSDPSEILGPLSMKGLKNDEFKRIPDGKLPTAHVAFLDEVYKANSATLNTLLSIMNEKVWYNNGKEEPVSLRLLIGASNEMPESDEGLHAFHDRFVIRHWVDYIQDGQNQFNMLKQSVAFRAGKLKPSITQITLEEIDALHQAVAQVEVSDLTLNNFQKLVFELTTKKGFKISDRRLVACVHLMQANALLDGRTVTDPDDMEHLAFVLWEKKEDIEQLQDMILKFMDPFKDRANKVYKRVITTREETLAVTDPTDRANKAVEARTYFEKSAKQMEKIIAEAKAEGRNTEKFETQLKEIREITTEVVNKCLLNINDMLTTDVLPF